MDRRPARRRAGLVTPVVTLAFALVAALVGVGAAPSVSAASPPAVAEALPPGWSFDGAELTWSSPSPLRLGGARYEVRDGDRAIGIAVQDGDVLRVATPVAPTAPSVWAAGRRIDVPAVARAVSDRAPDPSLTVAAADPADRGPYRTTRLRYSLPGLSVDGYAAPIEVVGEVIAPVGAAGPRPVVLFLHGRHSTCFRGGPDGEPSGDWPCPPGWKPVPSHTGYRYMADVLASQGYLTVSISANGVNGQDGIVVDGGASARSQLVRHHLALWARWAVDGGDPWGGRFRGRVDLDRVVLVGHSRGGEGVARATIDSEPTDPWRVRGLVLVGPTAFGRQVPAGVHTTVILPACDGDVSDLQGQQYVDAGRDLAADGALRSSVLAMGTNHNFFNTEWTPGLSRSPAWDDWFAPDDPQCGDRRERRLTPSEQQAVGLAYTSALVDLALAGDATALPLLDGSRVKPRSIGRAVAHVHAIGGAKPVLYAPGTGAAVRSRGLTVRECAGHVVNGPFSVGSDCTPDLMFELLPHWSPVFTAETAPAPVALEVRWRRQGGSVAVPITGGTAGVAAIDLRIAGAPGADGTDLRVRVRDADGRVAAAALRPGTVWPYWGDAPLGKVLAKEFRVVLPRTGIDPERITEIELLPGGRRGVLWLLDAVAFTGSAPAPAPLFLPRVSVGRVTVDEGDAAGTRMVDVPVTVDRPAASATEVWVQLTDYSSPEPRVGFPLVIPPGTSALTVPVPIRSDDRFSPYVQSVQVTLLARRGAFTGDYAGGVDVIEDDPAPVLTVDAAEATATEGGQLAWTFRLSEPVDADLFWSVRFADPAGRFRELDTDDLPVEWFEQWGLMRPDEPVPLSSWELWLWIQFAPGESTTTLVLPIADDALAEPEEGTVLVLDDLDDPILPGSIELVGRVTGG